MKQEAVNDRNLNGQYMFPLIFNKPNYFPRLKCVDVSLGSSNVKLMTALQQFVSINQSIDKSMK